MNWLFPGFLASGFLVGLPVLLHFLRSKPKVVVRFPSLRFLGETALRDTRRHRLRRWLTLLLRCLIIALLAATFARPFWIKASAMHRCALVVALDNSMSMQARGREDEQRAWALRQLADLQPGDQAALLVMHPSPAWLVPMTDDLAQVRAALQDAAPGFEKTDYAPAWRVAAEALAANPAEKKILVWMADEQRAGWLGMDFAQPLPPGVKVRMSAAAPAVDRQAALVALHWSGLPPNESVIATVRLFAPREDQRRITVRDGARVLVEKTISLQAGDNQVELKVSLPAETPGVRVALDPDDLPADDVAWLATGTSTAQNVLLDAGTGTDFITHALLSTVKIDTGGDWQPMALPEKTWPADAVAILRNPSSFKVPRVNELDRFVQAGGSVWIFVDGSPEQSAWLKKYGVLVTERPPAEIAEHLRDWDSEHPALAAFAGQSMLPLLEVEFYRGFSLAGEALVPFANWPDGKVALAEWSGGGRRILLAGFPLDRAATNWPAQPSFVPFVHQAMRWLHSSGAARQDWRIGDIIPLPAGEGKWRALDAATPQQERVVSGSVRPAAPGLYEFTAGPVRKVFAVSFPPEESDLTPWPQPEKLRTLETNGVAPSANHKTPAPPAFPVSDENSENQQRLWWWILAVCGVALLAELALANRTTM